MIDATIFSHRSSQIFYKMKHKFQMEDCFVLFYWSITPVGLHVFCVRTNLLPVMFKLTIPERTEIVGLYTGNTARNAAEIFNNRYPNRLRPLAHGTVSNIWRKFNATGSVHDQPRSGRPSKVRNQNIVNVVLNMVNANPRTSTRALANATHHSRNTIMAILHNNGFHPYKAQPHNQLYVGDNIRRVEFCTGLIDLLNDSPWMIDYILWTDESLFRRIAPFNRQNDR